MKLKNILIICPFFRPNIGGVESHLNLLTKYLVKHGYRITVLTYKPLATQVKKYKKIEKSKNLIIYRYWWFGNKIFDKTTPYPFVQFIYIIPGLLINTLIFLFKNHKKIDIIHAHGFAAAFITRLCCYFFNLKRKIVSTHYLYPNLNTTNITTKILKWTFNGFDKILTVSNKSRDQLQKIGINKNKMSPFYHWLDHNDFRPLDKTTCREEMGLDKKFKFIFLFIGRVIRMKGVFTLLKVSQKISPDIALLIIGDGPDIDELKTKSKKLSNFIILGKKKHSEINKFLSACDMLILPSISEEAQPFVVMESLMCGRPVITTNKGSVVEMFEDNVGFKIDPSVEKIVSIIRDITKNPQKLIDMSKKARIFALNKYSYKNAKIIVNIYKK